MTKKESNTKKEIESYHPLVFVVVNKILHKDYKYLRQHRDDLNSEGLFGLLKAIDTYDETKGSSKVSYYSQGIRTAVYHYIRDFENAGTPNWYISIDDIEIPKEEETEYVDPSFELIDKYEPADEVNKEIYHRIIMGNLTARELSEELGVSINSIRMRKKKLIKRLRKQMTNGGVLC